MFFVSSPLKESIAVGFSNNVHNRSRNVLSISHSTLRFHLYYSLYRCPEPLTEGPEGHFAHTTTTKIHPHNTIPFSPTPWHRRDFSPAKTHCSCHLTISFPLLPLPGAPISNSPQSDFDSAKHSFQEASVFDRRGTEP